MATKKTIVRFDDYVKGIGSLKPDEQLSLIGIISARLKKTFRKKGGKHRVMELEGLGSRIWKEIDPQQYVNEERKSWD